MVHLAFRFRNSKQDGNGDGASYLSSPCCSLFRKRNGDVYGERDGNSGGDDTPSH